jgi:hypothetical protein
VFGGDLRLKKREIEVADSEFPILLDRKLENNHGGGCKR